MAGKAAKKVTPVDRIAADGAEITFADGSTHRLRFSMRALLELERDLGGVGPLLTALNQKDRDLTTPVLTTLLKAGRCALLDEFPRLTLDNLALMVLPAQILTWVGPLAAAIDEAFPPPPRDGSGNDQAATAAPDPSGTASSAGTSPSPSSSDDPTPSSGG